MVAHDVFGGGNDGKTIGAGGIDQNTVNIKDGAVNRAIYRQVGTHPDHERTLLEFGFGDKQAQQTYQRQNHQEIHQHRQQNIPLHAGILHTQGGLKGREQRVGDAGKQRDKGVAVAGGKKGEEEAQREHDLDHPEQPLQKLVEFGDGEGDGVAWRARRVWLGVIDDFGRRRETPMRLWLIGTGKGWTRRQWGKLVLIIRIQLLCLGCAGLVLWGSSVSLIRVVAVWLVALHASLPTRSGSRCSCIGIPYPDLLTAGCHPHYSIAGRVASAFSCWWLCWRERLHDDGNLPGVGGQGRLVCGVMDGYAGDARLGEGKLRGVTRTLARE